MPIYEYVCGSCGKKTEAIQRMGEEPLQICPHCGGELKKAFSAPAIQFKGSGWYVTDYARAKKEEPSGGSEKSDKKSEKSDKKEDKAEAKSEKTEKASESKSESKGPSSSGSSDSGSK